MKESKWPAGGCPGSQLSQWPVQIKLVPVKAPYFDGANLLIAADCTAYAYGDFHNRFIRNRITLVGCPKLDEGDYTEKLTAIIRENNIKSVTIVRMEVPCCGGLERAAVQALKDSGKFIPWQVVGHLHGGQRSSASEPRPDLLRGESTNELPLRFAPRPGRIASASCARFTPQKSPASMDSGRTVYDFVVGP